MSLIFATFIMTILYCSFDGVSIQERLLPLYVTPYTAVLSLLLRPAAGAVRENDLAWLQPSGPT